MTASLNASFYGKRRWSCLKTEGGGAEPRLYVTWRLLYNMRRKSRCHDKNITGARKTPRAQTACRVVFYGRAVMWRLVALDIVFHLHSIRDFSIRLDKDWSVLQPTRASWFLLYASLRRFITLQRRQCKLWTQNQPVRLWQRWGYGAKETMSISGCIRERREIASLLFVCAGVTCSMNM